MAVKQIKRLNWWHREIIAWMIANPDRSLGRCAKHFSVSQPWLSVIINSDMFREALADAQADHLSAVSHTISDKLTAVAHQTLDEISERLDVDAKQIPLRELRNTGEMTLKALGYTSSPAASQNSPVNINVGVAVSSEVLENARAKMKAIGHTVDIEAIPAKVEDGEKAEYLPAPSSL